MSTHLKEKQEKLLRILERLAQESAKGTPILVEGRRDTEALRKLTITGKIMTTKTSGKSFLDVVSEVKNQAAEEVILLMDFDRRGKEWMKKLKHHLERMRIKPNTSCWKNLLSLIGHDVKDVEGLVGYMKTLEKKTRVSSEGITYTKESPT